MNWKVHSSLTSVIPFRKAFLASSPGPSTVLPSSLGPQLALYTSIYLWLKAMASPSSSSVTVPSSIRTPEKILVLSNRRMTTFTWESNLFSFLYQYLMKQLREKSIAKKETMPICGLSSWVLPRLSISLGLWDTHCALSGHISLLEHTR